MNATQKYKAILGVTMLAVILAGATFLYAVFQYNVDSRLIFPLAMVAGVVMFAIDLLAQHHLEPELT